MATMTVTEFAATLDASPREVRKFLRSVETLDAPGKGGRWAIEKRDARSLTKKFEKWAAEKATPETPADADDAELADDDTLATSD